VIPPHTLCRWFGHRREGYNADIYWDRHGRQRHRWHQRCTRCGTSDGAEVFREGILERFTVRRILSAIYDYRFRLRLWWREDCDDCHKPVMRFGRKVGDHDNCDVMPF
jgi:hypothetical protein